MPELLLGLEFKNPYFLLAAFIAPLIYWLAQRHQGAITYSSNALPMTARRSLRARLSWLPAFGYALATVCLAVALAGPRSADGTTRVKREGIAIMLVIDRSGSMDARDFVEGDYSVNRLAAVKQVLRQFVLGSTSSRGRVDDLIGVVAFGTFADSISPLTLDHANLINIVNQTEVAQQQSEAATAIGEGLGLAVERLRQHPAKSKVIILLTDGVNNAGDLEPAQAAELAAQHNIKVYTISAGTSGVAPIPAMGSDGRIRLRAMRVEIDERTLKNISARTGGRYFSARDAEGIKTAYEQIDQLERSEITETRYLQYNEHYFWFALLALVLVIVSELATTTLFRRLP